MAFWNICQCELYFILTYMSFSIIRHSSWSIIFNYILFWPICQLNYISFWAIYHFEVYDIMNYISTELYLILNYMSFWIICHSVWFMILSYMSFWAICQLKYMSLYHFELHVIEYCRMSMRPSKVFTKRRRNNLVNWKRNSPPFRRNTLWSLMNVKWHVECERSRKEKWSWWWELPPQFKPFGGRSRCAKCLRLKRRKLHPVVKRRKRRRNNLFVFFR